MSPSLSRFTASWRTASATLVSLISAASAFATPPWVTTPGDPIVTPGIAAVSCAAPARDYPSYAPLAEVDSFAFGLFDLRTPPPGTYSPNVTSGLLWPEIPYHHPDWNVKNIGQIYGIALKPAGEIFLTAHGVYGAAALQLHKRYGDLGGGPFDLNAAGTVYRIDPITEAPSVFAVIPGQQVMTAPGVPPTGPGLGNIAYDPNHAGGQFFVTSLEDGKIYRVDNTGTTLPGPHDPLTPDDGSPGLPPSGERVWGVAILEDTLYYGTWSDASTANQIRSVNLDPSGAMIPSSDTLVLTLPLPTASWGSLAVADLAFNSAGTELLVGERTFNNPTNSYNHNSRVHRVETTGWTVTRSLKTGNNTLIGGGGEAYGGVSYGQEGGVDEALIWMTSADMAAVTSGNSPGPHGLFGVRPTDFPGTPAFTPDAFKVPFDPAFSSSGPDNKGSGGDIEILADPEDCVVNVTEIQCPTKLDQPHTITLEVTNLSDNVGAFVLLNPCPGQDLPPGAITTHPAPGLVALATPLGNGMQTTLTQIELPNAPLNGGVVCFLVTLLDASGNACCTRKVCVDLPPCDCAAITGHEIACELQADGTLKYTVELSFTNLTHLSADPSDFSTVTLLPGSTLSPGLDPLSVSSITVTPSPVAPGDSGILKFCYVGTPGPIYTNLSFHNETFEECCAVEDYCIELPECDPTAIKDECEIASRAPCNPNTGLATVPFTICNNGTVPKVYALSALPTPTALCPVSLPLSSFSLPATVGPIAPGDCVTTLIQIDCSALEQSDCAQFEICAQAISPVAEERLCCPSTVYIPDDSGVFLGLASDGDRLVIPDNGVRDLRIEVVNTTDEAQNITLSAADDERVLQFAGGVGNQRDGFLTQLTLPAQGSANVILNASRTEVFADLNGVFTNFIVEAIAEGRPPATLITPLRLDGPRRGDQRRVAIESIRLLPSESKIELALRATPGARYVVEQRAHLGDAEWEPVPCEIDGETADSAAGFVATSEEMTCRIDCDLEEASQFFRIQAVSSAL